MQTSILPPVPGPAVATDPAPATDPLPTVPLTLDGTAALPTGPQPPGAAPVPDRLRAARLLVLLELLVAAVSAVESAVVAGVGFGSFGAAVATAAVAAVLARQSGRLGRGRVTRTLRVTQWTFLTMAAVDLLVAQVVAHAALLPLSVLVRVLLPVAVLALTHEHRPAGIRRSRRERRAAAAAVTVAAR